MIVEAKVSVIWFWRFIGTKGSMKWDGNQGFSAEAISSTGDFWSSVRPLEVTPYTDKEKTEGHASCIREFIDAVREGTEPGTICTDNIKSLAMVFGAIESAETGERFTDFK